MGVDGKRQGAGCAGRGGGSRGAGESQLLGHRHGGGLAVAKGRGAEMDGHVMAGMGMDWRRKKRALGRLPAPLFLIHLSAHWKTWGVDA